MRPKEPDIYLKITLLTILLTALAVLGFFAYAILEAVNAIQNAF